MAEDMKVAKSTMDLVIFLLVLFSQVVGQTVPPTGGSLSSTTDPTTCGIGSITCSTYETLASSIELPVSSQIPSQETTTSIPAAQEGNAVSPSAIPTENVTKNQFEITTQIQKKTTTSTTTVPPTASPIAQKPLEEATLGYDNSGICACDLTSYSCDINCCCDPECSPFHRTSFSHCQVEGYPPYDNRYCYASKLVFLNNSEHILKQTQNGAFCIVRSNLAGSVLYPSHSAIISNQEFSKLWRQAHVSFWPEPSSGILLSIEKPKPYKAGSPIWILQNNQILSLELPASGLTTTCSAMKRVPYLLPSSSQCIRKVPSTQKDCEKVSLGLIRQISGIVQSPMLINQTGMISKRNETCPGSICAPVKYFTCSGPPFENSSADSCKNISIERMVFGLKSSICHGIVKKLMLVFHHNGTAGLEHVEAYMWLLNMSLAEEWSTQSLHQSFSVEFKWITSNSTAEKIMNSTASQAKSVMFSRSGNRGYTVGKPVIAGLKLMSNSNSSKDVTNGSRGSINFHTIELSPDSKQWITLPKSNLYGMAVNMAVKCYICKETVDKRKKSIGYLECVKLNCANLVHIDCTTLNFKYIAKWKQNFQCNECKASDLTSKHVSNAPADSDSDVTPSDTSVNSVSNSDSSPSLLGSTSATANADNSDSESDDDSLSGQTIIDHCTNEACNTTRNLLLGRVSSLEKELSVIKTQNTSTDSKEILRQLVKISGSLEEVKTEVEDLKKSTSAIMELQNNPTKPLVDEKKLLVKKIETKKKSFSSNKIKMCEGNILKLPNKVAIAHCVASDLKMSDGLALHIKNKYKIDTNELLKLNKKKGDTIYQKIGDTELLHLITKEVSHIPPKWKDYKNTLKTIPKTCEKYGIKKLIVPKLGSGLDKIPWASTMKLLKNVCSESNLELIVLSLPKKDELTFKFGVKNKNLKKNVNTVDTKIKLIGDSHVKGLSEQILPLIPPTTLVEYSASGGATTEQVNQDLNILTSDLTNNDYLISFSGSNDIKFTKNGKCLSINVYEDDKKNVISQSGHTNVLVLSTPYRYDIPEANYYIDMLNDETEKIIKTKENNVHFQDRIRYLEINSFLDRSCYGRSGIHLNNIGKQILSEAIMQEINKFPKGLQAPQIWDLIEAIEDSPMKEQLNVPEVSDDEDQGFGLFD